MAEMHRLRNLVLLMAAATTAVVSAQSTIIVQGGTNAYVNAVRSAQAGDVLLVRPGYYSATTATVGITVVCDPGVQFFVWKRIPFGVRGVPLGQQFVMRGGSITNFEGEQNIVVESCKGAVVFESVTTGARESVVRDSSNVAFHSCSLNRGLDVFDSTVSLAHCSVDGVIRSLVQINPALNVVRSDVSLADCTVTGGGFSGLRSSPAIWLAGGSLTLAGDAAMVIQASTGTGVPARAVDSITGTIWIDPAVILVSLANPKIGGGAVVVTKRIPWTQAPAVMAGQTFRAVTTAEVGGLVALFLSWPVQPTATAIGMMWVSPTSPVLDIGIVPASGLRTATLRVPAIPAAQSVVVQPLQLSTQGSLFFGPPTFVVLN